VCVSVCLCLSQCVCDIEKSVWCVVCCVVVLCAV